MGPILNILLLPDSQLSEKSTWDLFEPILYRVQQDRPVEFEGSLKGIPYQDLIEKVKESNQLKWIPDPLTPLL
jgi:hypothetical protein